MAKQVTVTLVDDIDATKTADESVEFAIDGVTYEIDLAADNAEKLRELLAPWVAHSRRVGGRRRNGKGTGVRPSIDREQATAIRDWARRNGHNISARGRISSEIVDAYNTAHAS